MTIFSVLGMVSTHVILEQPLNLNMQHLKQHVHLVVELGTIMLQGFMEMLVNYICCMLRVRLSHIAKSDEVSQLSCKHNSKVSANT